MNRSLYTWIASLAICTLLPPVPESSAKQFQHTSFTRVPNLVSKLKTEAGWIIASNTKGSDIVFLNLKGRSLIRSSLAALSVRANWIEAVCGPKNGTFAFALGDSGLAVGKLANGRVSLKSMASILNTSLVAIRPDGKMIAAFGSRKDRPQGSLPGFYIIDFAQGGPQLVSKTPIPLHGIVSPSNLDWSADGKQLIYSVWEDSGGNNPDRDQFKTYACDIQSGKTTMLFSSVGPASLSFDGMLLIDDGPSLSPNGHYLTKERDMRSGRTLWADLDHDPMVLFPDQTYLFLWAWPPTSLGPKNEHLDLKAMVQIHRNNYTPLERIASKIRFGYTSLFFLNQNHEYPIINFQDPSDRILCSVGL